MSLFFKKPRVRFAPSPTGYLHLGGLRTALYNYLYARQNGGVFVLRIEDTDRTRMVEQGTEKLIQTLRIVGLEYDEGPHRDGELMEQGAYGPYVQSKRLGIYKKYVEELVKKKKAYHCFCSAERLDQLRQEQTDKKQPTMYDKK